MPSSWDALTLSPEHEGMLAQSGISAEIAQQRGYFTAVDPSQMPSVFSEAQRKRVPCLVIPVWGVDATDVPVGYRMRPDEPMTDSRGRGKPRVLKYEQAKGAALRLDVPPSVQPMLSDPAIPLVLTEGEKKADAGASAGIVTVSLPGVWGFRGTDPATGGKLELPDLDRIAWNARDVWLAFDSDVVENGQVQKALSRLSGILTRRGASVHVLRLPASGTGGKQGLDDVLAAMPNDADKFALLTQYEDPAFWATAEDNRSIAERLRDYILDEYELGQDEDGNGFALPRTGPRIVRMLYTGRPSLHSEAPVRFAQADAAKPVVPQRVVSDVLAYIAGLCYDAPKTKLHLRVANYSDHMIIDLGRADGKLARVDANGWQIIAESDTLFRRSDNLRELAEPETGGSINELRSLINVVNETWPLVHGWLIGSLFSDVPVPWLFCTGPQGSGKSDAALFILNTVDPRPALQAPPRKGDRSDPAATAANSYLLGYDNMTSISQEHSDWLCALVTGAVDERRILHTTASTQTLSIKRSGVLTGISVSGIRADLAERLVTVDFERITGADRKAHGGLTERFNAARGRIFGALLDGVSQVFRCLPDVDGDSLDVPRMADYARVLKAYDLANDTTLFESYRTNVLDTFADHAEDDPVASVVLSYMQTVRDTGEITPGELFDALTRHRDSMKVHDDAYWPTDARRFGRDLKAQVATLEGKVRVTLGRTKSSRVVRLTLVEDDGVTLTNVTEGVNVTLNVIDKTAGQSPVSPTGDISDIKTLVDLNIGSNSNNGVTIDEQRVTLPYYSLVDPQLTSLMSPAEGAQDETAGQTRNSAVTIESSSNVTIPTQEAPLTYIPTQTPALHDATTDRYGSSTPEGMRPTGYGVVVWDAMDLFG
jgi:hypothetical protein